VPESSVLAAVVELVQLFVQNVTSGAEVAQPGFLIPHLRIIVVLVVEIEEVTLSAFRLREPHTRLTRK
jgi:hypothetical protein